MIEILKALVLVGVVVRSAASRFWIGAIAAAAILYVSIGLIAVFVFGKLFPPITEILRARPIAIVAAIVVVAAVLAAIGRIGARTRPAWKEVGDLFALIAILEGVLLLWLLA